LINLSAAVSYNNYNIVDVNININLTFIAATVIVDQPYRICAFKESRLPRREA